MTAVRMVYFAWIRERIGRAEETLELPGTIKSVGQLLDWLIEQAPEYRAALSDRRAIRIAMDQVHAGLDQPLHTGAEIALFPPVTGG